MKSLIIKRGVFVILLNLVLFIFLVECGKDNPTSPKITNVNGNWSGKTSQNENMSFTVSSDSVTFFKIKVITPGQTSETWQYPTDCVVTNNSFSLNMSGYVTITGNFKSNTSSEGTFISGSTSGTWSATKQ